MGAGIGGRRGPGILWRFRQVFRKFRIVEASQGRTNRLGSRTTIVRQFPNVFLRDLVEAPRIEWVAVWRRDAAFPSGKGPIDGRSRCPAGPPERSLAEVWVVAIPAVPPERFRAEVWVAAPRAVPPERSRAEMWVAALPAVPPERSRAEVWVRPMAAMQRVSGRWEVRLRHSTESLSPSRGGLPSPGRH